MRNLCVRAGVAAAAVLACVLMPVRPARAAISASATYTGQQVTPGTYRYDVTLQNTGDTNVSTFWFGWVVYPPIYDLLPNLPQNVQSPTGWSGQGLNDSFYGGYSTEWTTTTSPLAPGHTLTGFTFDSPDPPATMSGTSPVFPLFRTDTSWVYIGASQAPGDPGFRFQPTQVTPEPTCIALLTPLGLMLIRRRNAR